MKQRNIFAVILLSLVTLGIYQLYWLKVTRDEMAARGIKVPRFFILLTPILTLLGVALLQFIVRFLLASSDYASPNPVSVTANIISVLIGVIVVLSIVPVAVYWLYGYSNGVEQVTGGRTSSGFAFGIGLLLHVVGFGFVWPGVIQDSFNKSGAGPPSVPLVAPGDSPPPEPTDTTPPAAGPPASNA